MKNQYVGDASDYLKYSLLRALQEGHGRPLYVCWMLTEDDGGPDGEKLQYLEASESYRAVDPELFDALVPLASRARRSVSDIEEGRLLPRARFQPRLLPDPIVPWTEYFADVDSTAERPSLLFFDPDNGLETSKKKGTKNSSKFLYWDEVESLAEGRSLLIFQHWRRVKRDAMVLSLRADLLAACPQHDVFDLRGPHVLYLFATLPGETGSMLSATWELANRWPKPLQVDPPDEPTFLKPELPDVFSIEVIDPPFDEGPYFAKELRRSGPGEKGRPWGLIAPGAERPRVLRLIHQDGNLLTLMHDVGPFSGSEREASIFQVRLHPLRFDQRVRRYERI
jgi:hypothetical protein